MQKPELPLATNALERTLATMNHDVIAIGGSAGAVEVLLDLVPKLPADLGASIFVVLHTPASLPSPLPELLSKRGPFPAKHPLHGEKIERGHIYVAPPDTQLLLRQGSMEVVRGPKENGHRPAADALFRSASWAYSSRVIGVVLSGYQDCGTAGMMSIRARGGVTVVQNPGDALVAEMPRNVLASLPVDYAVDAAELPALLPRLVQAPAGRQSAPDDFVKQLEGAHLGASADLGCPICQGVLTEAHSGAFQQFRCHVGHTFSLDSLVREQSEELERALWASVRALEESGKLSQRLSHQEPGELGRRFAEKSVTQRQHADRIRQILLHGGMLSTTDSEHLT